MGSLFRAIAIHTVLQDPWRFGYCAIVQNIKDLLAVVLLYKIRLTCCCAIVQNIYKRLTCCCAIAQNIKDLFAVVLLYKI